MHLHILKIDVTDRFEKNKNETEHKQSISKASDASLIIRECNNGNAISHSHSCALNYLFSIYLNNLLKINFINRSVYYQEDEQ